MISHNYIQRLIDSFNQARTHFPQYRAALFWLLRDLCQAFPWAMIRLTAYSMLGASLQGAALVGAIQYVRSLEDGSSISIKGFSIATQGGQNLSLAVLAFFSLLAVSSWIMYLAKAVAARLVADYHTHLLKRALALFGTTVPGQPSPKDPSEALQSIVKTVVQDAQKSIMLVRFLGSTLPNLVILLYAFPILVYLDLSMTLILMVLAVFFLPLYYRDNVMSYESDLMNKRSGSGAKNTLTSLMEEIKDYQQISPKQIKTINKAFRRGELKDKMNFLSVFLLSIARTELWTNIMLSLAVCLVILIMVPGALAGDTPWSLLLGYLLFLKLGVNSFKSFMSFLTKFSRFYPYVHRYRNFVQGAEAKPNKEHALTIKSAAHGISEQDGPIEIQEPLLLALITRVPLSRYTFPYMVKLGTKADNGIFVSPRECFFIGKHGLPQKDGSLREMLGLPSDFEVNDLEQAMPEDLLAELKKHLGLNLDKNQGPQKWSKLSLAHRIELGIVAALLSPARVVVVDRDTLLQLPEVRSLEILDQLHSHKPLTVIRYPEAELQEGKTGQGFGEDLCAVSGCTGNLLALGLAEWMQANLEQIQDLLAKEQVRLKQGTDDTTSGEEMDDEE